MRSRGKKTAPRKAKKPRRVGTQLQHRLKTLTAERDAALAQQAASAEVLQMINSSPGNLTPVFDAILEKAHSLCAVVHGSLQLYDGEKFRAVAAHGLSTEFAARVRQGYIPGPQHRELLGGARFAQVDAAALDDPISRAAVELSGIRTTLFIPLRKDETLLGQIVAQRKEVRPFTEKEIALLETFAAQAVIAIENARLLDELHARTDNLQESLDYQTATGDVLKVISRSTFDLQPVFDTLLEAAAALCETASSALAIRQGDVYRYVATVRSSREYDQALRSLSFVPGRSNGVQRALLERKVVHIVDARADPDYDFPPATNLAGVRTVLSVPMFRQDEVIGVITLTRHEVKPFTERQIELVRTFADQAGIAIENARLINETREALEQQTATAEILQVINSSPGELAPVFDAMLEKAMRLCEASFGAMQRRDGDRFHLAAARNVPAPFVAFLAQPFDVQPGVSLDRLIRGEPIVHIVDVRETEAWPQGNPGYRALTELARARTVLWISLRKDSTVLGAFVLYRTEVRPFTDKQIALLQSFGAQAVIAMDNARLLEEIRQRQAELRVTFDNMGDGVAMFGADTRLAAWNRNFQQILEFPDELLAQRPAYADFVHILAERGEFGSEDVEAELSRRLQDTGRELRLERTRPDGRVIEVRRNPVPGGGFVLIYSDITERKRAEEAIRKARDAAERALRELQTAQASLLHAQKMAALGQLTAGIAHEIKNPLNFVNNFAGLSRELLDELKGVVGPSIAALDDDKRAELDDVLGVLSRNLEKIGEHGRRADGIVKSMLAHSRGGGGEWQATDLNALLEEALNLAYHGARAQDQSFNITMERDLDRKLRPIELVPQDVTRVFLNLIGNGFYAAARRSRAGDGAFRPVLKVTTRDLGDVVEIAVRDNGIGILPEHREKLFQPFFTTKPTGEGTGLGLSISYEIVTQQHSGSITVDSEVGHFTEFTIRLPRRQRSGAGTTA
jgi:PAS domain S-box-containing protein